jgi:hypothetical protein
MGSDVGATGFTLDAASRPARIPKGITVPANRRRVKQTILLQRGTIDISRESASPMPPMRPLPVRHLLKDPQDDTTLCDHRFGPGDTVEDSEIDPRPVACDKCATKASKS